MARRIPTAPLFCLALVALMQACYGRQLHAKSVVGGSVAALNGASATVQASAAATGVGATAIAADETAGGVGTQADGNGATATTKLSATSVGSNAVALAKNEGNVANSGSLKAKATASSDVTATAVASGAVATATGSSAALGNRTQAFGFAKSTAESGGYAGSSARGKAIGYFSFGFATSESTAADSGAAVTSAVGEALGGDTGFGAANGTSNKNLITGKSESVSESYDNVVFGFPKATAFSTASGFLDSGGYDFTFEAGDNVTDPAYSSSFSASATVGTNTLDLSAAAGTTGPNTQFGAGSSSVSLYRGG